MASLSLKCNQAVLEHVIRFLDELLPSLKDNRISEWIKLLIKDRILSMEIILMYTPLQKKCNTWFCGIPDLRIGSTSLRGQHILYAMGSLTPYSGLTGSLNQVLRFLKWRGVYHGLLFMLFGYVNINKKYIQSM